MFISPRFFYLPLMGSAALILAGCDYFKEKVVLPGQRETILTMDSNVKADSVLMKQPITVSPQQRNTDWPQAGGNPAHEMPNLVLDDPLKQTWSASLGDGTNGDQRVTAGPVVGGGRVFACNAMGIINAVNVKDGAILWSVNTLPEEVNAEAIGGGVAYDKGIVFGATAFGELMALQAETGKILWRKRLGAPSRVAPTIMEDKVYALTINNEIYCFNNKTGAELWSHSGITEAAGILGGASPAAGEGVAIAAYSSGEVFAFDMSTGQPLWGDLLNPVLRIDSVASIAHIRARPVIKGGAVYIISHGGQMVAFELKTGNRLWQREMGGMRSPALMGGTLFVVTNEADLVCVKKETGQIHWATALPRLDNDKKPILWAGPVIAQSSLILAGSNGQLLFASLQDGKILKTIDMGSATTMSPVVSEGALYVLTNEGNLLKYSAEGNGES